MTTMQDVAKLAGVSAKTVSRVFNDDPHVTDDTRRRVSEAMESLKYVPNMMARTFRSGRASVVGIAVPDIGDPFFAAIIRSVDRESRLRGMSTAVTSLGDDPALEQSTVESLLRLQVNGLIIAPIAADQAYLAPWLVNMPAVFIDRTPTGVTGDSFVEDDFGGAYEATRHLHSLGHTRVGFVGDADPVSTTEQRVRGYRQAVADLGLDDRAELLVRASTHDAADAVRRLLRIDDPPTAIFSSNARTSLEVFPALQRLDRTDVALVSFGDFPMAASLQPSVTVIDQDPDRLGLLATERLFTRIETPGKRLKRATVVPVQLVERGSSVRAS
ncbi:LacI family DNA-binding transcriptional regulator [Frondihabitans australicus]|uniref:LacI family transcriptional regulator n=1 Tax=Frondihabitans australicus TaxID=386892 RepID=A0A495IJA4_9MICO|nr:LacI family DNA-binding transcriptional regulator [Frondihabitans australicus]RKR75196.1 LacI family transcriptional regulator [Frondihabitans australicus]